MIQTLLATLTSARNPLGPAVPGEVRRSPRTSAAGHTRRSSSARILRSAHRPSSRQPGRQQPRSRRRRPIRRTRLARSERPLYGLGRDRAAGAAIFRETEDVTSEAIAQSQPGCGHRRPAEPDGRQACAAEAGTGQGGRGLCGQRLRSC